LIQYKGNIKYYNIYDIVIARFSVHNKLIIVVAQNLEKNKRWSAHDGMRESRESIKLDLVVKIKIKK
jgi:hypothetical protein